MKFEWADYAAVQAECGILSGNELTHNSSRNTRSQTPLLAEPLWTDPGLKSGISVCELISTSKQTNKQKQHRQGMNGQTFSQNPRKQGKSLYHHVRCSVHLSRVSAFLLELCLLLCSFQMKAFCVLTLCVFSSTDLVSFGQNCRCAPRVIKSWRLSFQPEEGETLLVGRAISTA